MGRPESTLDHFAYVERTRNAAHPVIAMLGTSTSTRYRPSPISVLPPPWGKCGEYTRVPLRFDEGHRPMSQSVRPCDARPLGAGPRRHIRGRHAAASCSTVRLHASSARTPSPARQHPESVTPKLDAPGGRGLDPRRDAARRTWSRRSAQVVQAPGHGWSARTCRSISTAGRVHSISPSSRRKTWSHGRLRRVLRSHLEGPGRPDAQPGGICSAASSARRASSSGADSRPVSGTVHWATIGPASSSAVMTMTVTPWPGLRRGSSPPRAPRRGAEGAMGGYSAVAAPAPTGGRRGQAARRPRAAGHAARSPGWRAT